MVVIDRQDCINKSNNLLAQPAYRPSPQDWSYSTLLLNLGGMTTNKINTIHYIKKG